MKILINAISHFALYKIVCLPCSFNYYAIIIMILYIDYDKYDKS